MYNTCNVHNLYSLVEPSVKLKLLKLIFRSKEKFNRHDAVDWFHFSILEYQIQTLQTNSKHNPKSFKSLSCLLDGQYGISKPIQTQALGSLWLLWRINRWSSGFLIFKIYNRSSASKIHISKQGCKKRTTLTINNGRMTEAQSNQLNNKGIWKWK